MPSARPRRAGRLCITSDGRRLAEDDGSFPTSEETHTSLGKRVPLEVLLAAVELLPPSATVFIEGTSLSPDVRAFLAPQQQEAGRNDLSGTIWPRSEQFHLPLSQTLIDGIRELAKNHAEPELMDHLVVYENDHILLAAGPARHPRDDLLDRPAWPTHRVGKAGRRRILPSASAVPA